MAKDNRETGNEAARNPSEQRHAGTEQSSESREYGTRNPRHHAGAGEGGFSLNNIAGDKEARSFVASAALIGIGALFEPELLGGMLLGAGAVYASRTFPLIGGILRPVVRTVIRVGYAATAKAGEMMAEASEEVQDMVAEARSDYQAPSASSESH